MCVAYKNKTLQVNSRKNVSIQIRLSNCRQLSLTPRLQTHSQLLSLYRSFCFSLQGPFPSSSFCFLPLFLGPGQCSPWKVVGRSYSACTAYTAEGSTCSGAAPNSSEIRQPYVRTNFLSISAECKTDLK